MIGRSDTTQMLPHKRPIDQRHEDNLFATLPVNLKASLAQHAGPYYHAMGDHNSYYTSVKKMDVPSKSDYLQHPYWDLADNFMWDIWFPHLSKFTRIMHTEELFTTLNLKTSPGVPLTSMGFHKKKDVLMSHWGQEYLFSPFAFEPVWRVVAKQEWYHQTDLINGKVRTFIIPPFKFLIMQKIYFQAQNSGLKDHHWSAYGFNPYYGGVHRLATKLIGRGDRIYGMYDVKGWDRLLGFLKDIYSMRVHCHHEQDREQAAWVASRTCDSHLLLADGTIVRKTKGNNSGSNNTTDDNILAHEKLLAYFLLRLFDGDVEQLQDVISALFGDDNVFSLHRDVGSFSEIKALLIEVFSEFGYELDPVVLSDRLEDMEFLGFKFGFKHGYWLPFYKVDKIVASFCYVFEKRIPVSAQVSKAFSLLVMLWPHGGRVYELACEAYSRYLVDLTSSDDPTVTAYVTLGVPSFNDLLGFYTGVETSPSPIAHLFIFNMEAGGFKNEQQWAWSL